MRILGADFVSRYRGKLVNIHPSLLPAYGGLDTPAPALQEGDKLHGDTLPFVTPDPEQGTVMIHAGGPVCAVASWKNREHRGCRGVHEL